MKSRQFLYQKEKKNLQRVCISAKTIRSRQNCLHNLTCKRSLWHAQNTQKLGVRSLRFLSYLLPYHSATASPSQRRVWLYFSTVGASLGTWNQLHPRIAFAVSPLPTPICRKSLIYNKPTRRNSGSIVFINNYKYALHVSDALCVHHQEHCKL